MKLENSGGDSAQVHLYGKVLRLAFNFSVDCLYKLQAYPILYLCQRLCPSTSETKIYILG